MSVIGSYFNMLAAATTASTGKIVEVQETRNFGKDI
jgi:hypothetical protein